MQTESIIELTCVWPGSDPRTTQPAYAYCCDGHLKLTKDIVTKQGMIYTSHKYKGFHPSQLINSNCPGCNPILLRELKQRSSSPLTQ
jgi:hypothetical protein